MSTTPGQSPDGEAAVAAPPGEEELLQPLERPIDSAPPWVGPIIRQTIWRVVGIGLGMAVLVLMLLQARGLISTLVIALFLSIAMDPAVSGLARKRGWSRGRATGLVFITVVIAVVLLIGVLIPALVQVASEISTKLPEWFGWIDRTFATNLGSSLDAAAIEEGIRQWLTEHGRDVLGLAGSTVGIVFQFFTVATFTLYFAAGAPKIRQALLVRLPPQRQARLGWAWDTAIEQTGGYFYSRLVLLVVNATLFFLVLIAVGVPWLIALPLAVFQGFFAEFIPVVGTYIGVAIPTLVVLGLQGLAPTIIVLIWVLIYQQVENYWLSPKLSAQSMEINGGVAFGSALAGGAVAGPMGAFMAMPIAAMLTSFLKHYVRRYPLAYQSPYDVGHEPAQQEAGQPQETAAVR
jgi:predicted PurR-regulated permease PerM